MVSRLRSCLLNQSMLTRPMGTPETEPVNSKPNSGGTVMLSVGNTAGWLRVTCQSGLAFSTTS